MKEQEAQHHESLLEIRLATGSVSHALIGKCFLKVNTMEPMATGHNRGNISRRRQSADRVSQNNRLAQKRAYLPT